MQEDKEPVFETVETLDLCLTAMAGMIADLTVHRDRLAAAAGAGFSTATDIADWLVRELGLPFRDAHHVTGAIVKLAEDKGVGLEDLSLGDLQSVEPRITAGLRLDPAGSAAARTSLGGTAPDRVREACAAARQRFLNSEDRA
jgi:argininosuccinate lyase